MRTVIVGDVHGCRDELDDLLWKIGAAKGDRVVFVGDVVARGPDPRGVLALARQLDAVIVRGNHEDKLLRSRSDPNVKLSSIHEETARKLGPDDWETLAETRLFFAVPQHEAVVVHAGILPGVPVDLQTRETLLSIRTIDPSGAPSDKNAGTPWGSVYRGPPHVVFGHFAQKDVQIHPWATGLDTGCVYGGALTAMVLRDGEKVPDVAHRREVLVSVPARKAYFGGGRA